MSISRGASLYRRSKRVPLTKEMVQDLRKDFLLLVSNSKRLKDYDQARAWKEALLRWREYLENIFKQIREDLEGRIRAEKYAPREKRVSVPHAEYYLKHMSPIWDFAFEVGSIDIPAFEYVNKYTGAGESRESALESIQEKVRKWDQRVRRKSQAAWKWLDGFVEWTLQGGFYGGGEEAVDVNLQEVEIVRLEGFAVQMVGYESTDTNHVEALGRFKAGLAHYRKRAAQVYPWLLRYQLPFVADFSEHDMSAAATYDRDHISLTIWGLMSENPAKSAAVLAHEMGHHIWHTALSDEIQGRWRELSRTQIDLDLREVLKKMHPDESTYEFERRIQGEDPILTLQLETLMHDPRYRGLDLLTIESIQKYLEGGGDPILQVAASPITGYAAKNQEEAFCETLGLLVGYGPHALLPEVRGLLHVLIPGVKVGSMGREAVIREEDGQYCVRSPSNPDWSGGCFDTKGEAEDRLKQVEYFKRQARRVVVRYLLSPSNFAERWYTHRQEDLDVPALKGLRDDYGASYSGVAYRVTEGKWTTPPTSWTKTWPAMVWYVANSPGEGNAGQWKGEILRARLHGALDPSKLEMSPSQQRTEILKAKEVIDLEGPSSVEVVATVIGNTITKVGEF